jgi:carotenoid 1,2-hydratase
MSLAIAFDRTGAVGEMPSPPIVDLPPTLWRLPRATRSDSGEEAGVKRTFEDGPFYARSLVSARLFGEPVTAIHESLSLDRFRSRWVQMLLPFRMPRSRR